MKKYFVYRFRNNPDLNKTYKLFKELFGEGYIFEEKYPNANKLTRGKIIQK